MNLTPPSCLLMLVIAQVELAAQVTSAYGIMEGESGVAGSGFGDEEVDGSLVMQAEERRRERELRKLTMPDSVGVTFVEDEGTMRGAALVLREATRAAEAEVHGEVHAIGVDVEWKPVRRVGEREVVQILQIATPCHVVVLDIPALLREAEEQRAGDALDILLKAVREALECRPLVKLGFQVSPHTLDPDANENNLGHPDPACTSPTEDAAVEGLVTGSVGAP